MIGAFKKSENNKRSACSSEEGISSAVAGQQQYSRLGFHYKKQGKGPFPAYFNLWDGIH